MSEQEFNSKSPAWHMAQCRKHINKAKELNQPFDSLKDQRREYWEALRERCGGMVSSHLPELAAKMVNAA